MQTTPGQIDKALERAAEMGRKAGKNAASWIIQDSWGGRVTRGEKQAASAFLEAYEDGGDTPSPPNLSGEWADSKTPHSLMESLFNEEDLELEEVQDAQDDICTAWEDAASDAFYSTLQESAQSVLAA
jgi:hypothetical protein